MIYLITAVLAALGSLAAWVYSLLQQNRSLKDQHAIRDQADHIKEWHDRINQQNGVIAEDIRNYEELKRRFDDGNPPSGAV